jgi:Histidine kinase/Histidine kinase-, DNA gyrase B-, and HSP90-like ATPase
MSSSPSTASQWLAFRAGVMQAFHRYASWLVGISWKRFLLLSVLLILITAITQSLPPFRYTVTEEVDEPIELPELPELPKPPKAPQPSKAPKEPVIQIEKPAPGASAPDGVDISIDERGIRIRPRSAASAASSADSGIRIDLPNSAAKEIVQEAIEEARQAVRDAAEAQREAQQDADAAAREAQAAAREAIESARRALKDAGIGGTRKVKRQRTVHWGDFLTDLALIWIVASAIIKMVYKGRIQAEVKAAQATETAEAESLKRQVVEARMAAMQAQVEPHFLFNTLASIDHLIETDPPRASQMQKNLIALLRASMPTMREAGGSNGGVRDLGRELAVIRPYLEILKVRMEERLTTEIDVPEGLHSAEFPPMMIQTLVENAIKHGLEPKAEGGHLKVKAEVLHGKLAVSVADTGLGFGKAATAGTGVGLANVRERLQLLYGAKASVAVTENQPTGTVVTITVPYKPIEGVSA